VLQTAQPLGLLLEPFDQVRLVGQMTVQAFDGHRPK